MLVETGIHPMIAGQLYIGNIALLFVIASAKRRLQLKRQITLAKKRIFVFAMLVEEFVICGMKPEKR